MRRSLNHVFALRCRLWSNHLTSCDHACAQPQANAFWKHGVLSVRHQFNEADAALDQAKIVAAEMKQQHGGIEIFDSTFKACHRDRAAYLGGRDDPLLSVATDRLLDRLEDCKKTFPVAAVMGGAAEHVISRLAGGRSGIKHVMLIDTSDDMLSRIKARREEAIQHADHASVESSRAVDDEWPTLECVRMDGDHLPLAGSSVDVVISSLGLHWHNDLPGVLAQCRMALKPDGLFLGSMFGGETLNELRMSCAAAQLERQGGVSPITSPLAQVRDCGNLLTRAGLTLPTVDVDAFCLNYPSVPDLIRHLRAMGESNAVLHRQRVLKRETALAAAAMYQIIFGAEDGSSIPATYQVMYMTGWSPHDSQPKAAARGSATVSFQDLATGLSGDGKPAR